MAAVLQYVRVFAAILFYLCMYVCVGALMPEKVHEKSLINMLIAGFMAYFVFFQVIALFCKAKGVPLHVLSALWFSFLVAAAALDLVFRRQMLAECIRKQIRRIKKEAVLRGMLAASVAFANVMEALDLRKARISLTPSPVIATFFPLLCKASTIACFCSGETRAKMV